MSLVFDSSFFVCLSASSNVASTVFVPNVMIYCPLDCISFFFSPFLLRSVTLLLVVAVARPNITDSWLRVAFGFRPCGSSWERRYS